MPQTTRLPAKPSLYSVSISTTQEASEAVADLLERVTRQSPVTTHDRIRKGTRVAAFLPGPVPADTKSAIGRSLRAGLESIRDCGLDTGEVRIAWTRVAQRDWRESWKRHFRPLELGRVLLVRPSWIRRTLRPGQRLLVLDPGLSFGTGQHPTTEFCLRQVVRLRPRGQAAGLLDVGTGSGILALAAAKIGFSPVHALDFDPEAVEVARKNAVANHVDSKIRLGHGDVAGLSRNPRTLFEVVCANLTADLLLQHADRLAAQVRPGGTLVLAGILTEEFEAVSRVFRRLGLAEVRRQAKREWCSGAFAKPDSSRSRKPSRADWKPPRRG